MNKTQITVNLAGIPLTYSLNNPEVLQVFNKFIIDSDNPVISLEMSREEILEARSFYPAEDATEPYVEYMELSTLTSDALLPYHRCIFHGTAFFWRGKAYIFTAPSGTGKTTQYALWKLIFCDEIRMINGDKPILEFRDDGAIWVHPSPWRGKEGMGRMESAELGGIIYLKQGPENLIRRLQVNEAVIPLFSQFILSFDNKQQIISVAELADKLIRKIPVWELINRGDEASARLCHDTILQQEELI